MYGVFTRVKDEVEHLFDQDPELDSDEGALFEALIKDSFQR
jgi:hypothetical protein